MSDWITANKGAGPWDFIPQEEKCGYVNNPRWTGAPASEVIHNPCGYWPKGVPGVVGANIYGLYEGTKIWAVHFDGNILTYLGKYVSPDLGLHGIDWFNNNLIVEAGLGATAKLRQISSTPSFPLVMEHTPFNSSDIPNSVFSNLLFSSGLSKYFYVSYPGEYGARVIRLNSALVKEARGCYATVTTGTDGNLYYYYSRYAPGGWDALLHPTTGTEWGWFWKRIDDNVCDGPITTWGVGIPYSAYGASSCFVEHQGSLYVLLSQSVSDYALRKLNPTTLAITATADLLMGQRIAAYNGVIYVLYGLTTASVKSYNASTLVEIADSGVLTYGRATYDLSDMLVTDEGVTLVTDAYTGTRAFYLLDRASLAVIKEVPAGTTGDSDKLYQRLAVFNGDYLVAATGQGVDIIERVGFQRVATLDLNLLVGGSLQQRVLVGPGESGGSAPNRCGTSPVWPMPV